MISMGKNNSYLKMDKKQVNFFGWGKGRMFLFLTILLLIYKLEYVSNSGGFKINKRVRPLAFAW